MKKGGAKRRTTEGLMAVRRNYIEGLISRVDMMDYGFGLKSGLTPKEQKMRNKALIALLYLSARRISEIVGRVKKLPDGSVDVWEGVTLDDFQFGEVENEKIMRMRIRVLKRGRAKNGLKVVMDHVDIRLLDPLSKYIIDWLNYCKEKGIRKPFNLTRQRAWQILHELDPNIWVHWFRHQRLTHLSDVMDPFELQDFAKFARIETALNYVHKSPRKILSKIREADKLWA
ncbi:hypothetical protein DRO19_00135 [Candidatus Bathyarchaeota archaeon]|nr:MAG: hypothetical protein DRO19_00135 [Candidatus Bathyarchaeota archaeon]